VPIEVTYGGGVKPPSFFDVFMDLDPNDTQNTGSMFFQRTAANEGIFHAFMPIRARFTFQNTAGGTGTDQAACPIYASDFLGVSNVPWDVITTP
jgi:hypothetical protein